MVNGRIRWACPKDAEDIVRLVRALAAFENEPFSSVKLSADRVLQDGFGSDRRFECLIAEMDGEVVGLALFYHNYSTWEGRPGLFVEDLYVEDSARGLGLGKGLMAALARVASERQCTRMELSVLHWNPAREFYNSLSMSHVNEWLPYRMTETDIKSLANTAAKIEIP